MLARAGRGSGVPGYAGSEPPGGAMETAVTAPAVTGQQDGHDEQLFAHYSTDGGTMHYRTTRPSLTSCSSLTPTSPRCTR